MSLLSFLKAKCTICKKKITTSQSRVYFDQKEKKIKVCLGCATYAERRAYKINR